MIRTVCTAFIFLAVLLPQAVALEIGETVEDVGTFLDVSEGQRLQLVIEEQKIVAHFVDAENLVVESPAESIVFEVNHSGRRTDKWRTVLTAGEGASMTSGRTLPPPYHLKVRVIIRFTDGSTKTFARTFLNLNRNIE
jgi:hypothetical protein